MSTTARNAASAVWRLVDGSEGLLGVKDPEIGQWREGFHRRDFTKDWIKQEDRASLGYLFR